MYLMNGKEIRETETVVDAAGTQYPPASWQSRMEELGIIVVEDPVRPDADLYDITDNGDGTFTSIPKPFEVALSVVENRIKEFRDVVKLSGGCEVEVSPGVFKWFHTDSYSKTQQLGLENEAIKILIAGGSLETLLTPVLWKTMDKSEVPMTASLALLVATAQKIRDGAVYGACEGHLTAIAQLPNVDALAGYPWKDSAWPAVFIVVPA